MIVELFIDHMSLYNLRRGTSFWSICLYIFCILTSISNYKMEEFKAGLCIHHNIVCFGFVALIVLGKSWKPCLFIAANNHFMMRQGWRCYVILTVFVVVRDEQNKENHILSNSKSSYLKEYIIIPMFLMIISYQLGVCLKIS